MPDPEPFVYIPTKKEPSPFGNCKFCGADMNHVGTYFPTSPYQHNRCTNWQDCQAHEYNGRWFTKAQWEEWIESAV